MILIVGLGNPGKKYGDTWHNLGFDAIEEIRAAFDLPALKKSTRFQAFVSEGLFEKEKIILVQHYFLVRKDL